MSDKRYIKVKATLKGGKATITESLEVAEGEYDYQVFERWKQSLLVNCGFEHVSADRE